MSFRESIQVEKEKQSFIQAYNKLSEKYNGVLFNDSNEFIGNTHFGIAKDLYEQCFGSHIDFVNRDLVMSFLKPFLENRNPTPDWRSVDGVSGKWQKNTTNSLGTFYISSIRKINKHTAIDFEFCKVFPNHWFMHCADYQVDNRKNNFPVFAHNKKTNKVEGYIFPVRGYKIG